VSLSLEAVTPELQDRLAAALAGPYRLDRELRQLTKGHETAPAPAADPRCTNASRACWAVVLLA
jgi:hypothetical protein